MANFNITLDESDFEILKKTKSFTIYNVQNKEKIGDFESPEDLLKSKLSPIASQLNKEAQKEGLMPDHYKLEYYLVLAKDEEESNSLGFIEQEDAILTASSEIQPSEVNGDKTSFKLFLLGVCL